ncbi:MAG: WYL domain-containing protein [Acidobacteria bacterium]|nr:WYL domain-containing protein [Acidobacteriota bacterium]
MSRLDRLYALAERLRRPGGSTIAALAGEFGVTERTVQRDLARLREQGLPVEGEPGRGGGLRLRGSALPPPLGLSLGEAFRLALAHRLSEALGALPSGGTLDLVLPRLVVGLPKEAGARLEALLRRVVLGHPPSPRVLSDSGCVVPSVYAACEEAFTHSWELELDYVDQGGRPSRRCVQPHGLLVQAPLWYLLAWDTAKRDGRMFRLDRILGARVRRSRGFLPQDPRQLFEEIARYGLERP